MAVNFGVAVLLFWIIHHAVSTIVAEISRAQV
jgi:hypothetical protein